MNIRHLLTKFGNEAKDQIVVTDDKGVTFYSYGSPIARKPADGSAIILHPQYWNYSATTNYYRGQFLGEGVAVTRNRIADGTYKMERFS